MEVMGLMLGEFVDDYTIRVADVFAMPQVRFFVFRWRKRRAKGKNLDLETQTHPLSFPLSKKKKKNSVRHGRLGRGRRPCLPDEDARHAAPGREARDGKFEKEDY